MMMIASRGIIRRATTSITTSSGGFRMTSSGGFRMPSSGAVARAQWPGGFGGQSVTHCSLWKLEQRNFVAGGGRVKGAVLSGGDTVQRVAVSGESGDSSGAAAAGGGRVKCDAVSGGDTVQCVAGSGESGDTSSAKGSDVSGDEGYFDAVLKFPNFLTDLCLQFLHLSAFEMMQVLVTFFGTYNALKFGFGIFKKLHRVYKERGIILKRNITHDEFVICFRMKGVKEDSVKVWVENNTTLRVSALSVKDNWFFTKIKELSYQFELPKGNYDPPTTIDPTFYVDGMYLMVEIKGFYRHRKVKVEIQSKYKDKGRV